MSNLKLPNLNYRELIYRDPGPIGYATTIAHDGETVLIMHHGSIIARLTDRTVTVDNCGWDSVTTANRINRVLVDNDYPIRCGVTKWQTVLRFPEDNGSEVPLEGPTTLTKESI